MHDRACQKAHLSQHGGLGVAHAIHGQAQLAAIAWRGGQVDGLSQDVAHVGHHSRVCRQLVAAVKLDEHVLLGRKDGRQVNAGHLHADVSRETSSKL